MNKKTVAIFEIVLCSCLWSIAGIFMKLIPWTGFAIGSIRSLLAGTVALVFLKCSGMHFVFNKRCLFGSLSLAYTMSLFCVSNKLTTAANAIVLQFTAPVFILIISAAFLHKSFSKADIIAVAVTFCGIALFFFDKIGNGSMLGDLVALSTGVSFGCYYISLGDSSDDERMSSIIVAHGLTFLIGLPSFISSSPEISSTSLLCIFILGVFQLGIPYVLLAKGSGYCPPLVCSLLGALEPLLNPLWVFLFDGEAPGIFAIVGGVIVVFTISIWCVYNGKHEAKTV